VNRLSFQKKERLRSSRDYRIVYDQRITYSGEYLVLHVGQNALGITRLGVVAGKKVASESTKRNRIKRLIREVYRTNKAKVRRNFDIIFVARARAVGKSYAIVEKEVLALLGRAGVLL
jgi:ribonuclease P protein component